MLAPLVHPAVHLQVLSGCEPYKDDIKKFGEMMVKCRGGICYHQFKSALVSANQTYCHVDAGENRPWTAAR